MQVLFIPQCFFHMFTNSFPFHLVYKCFQRASVKKYVWPESTGLFYIWLSSYFFFKPQINKIASDTLTFFAVIQSDPLPRGFPWDFPVQPFCFLIISIFFFIVFCLPFKFKNWGSSPNQVSVLSQVYLLPKSTGDTQEAISSQHD